MNEIPNYERLDRNPSDSFQHCCENAKRSAQSLDDSGGVEVNSRVLEKGTLSLSMFYPRTSEKTDVRLYPAETERLYEQLKTHFDNDNE